MMETKNMFRFARPSGLHALGILCGCLMVGVTQIQAQSTGSIEGTVVSAENGEPIASVSVFLRDGAVGVVSDRTGRFRLDGVPVGEHRLVAQRIGYAEAEQTIEVRPGEPLTAAFRLAIGPAVVDPIIVTASQRLEQLDALPVSVGVVSGQELRRMRPQHVGEPLNRIPGVHIVQMGSSDGSHNSIRQPLCCKPTILMLDNGIPFTSPAYYTTSQLKRVNYAQAGQVEVLKGPGTAVYGSDAVTGVINFVAPKPPVTPQSELTIEAGGAGFRRGMLSAGGTFGQHGLQLNLNYTDRDGRRSNPFQKKSGSLRWTAATDGGALFKTYVSFDRTDGTGSDDQTPEQFAARSSFNPYPIAFVDMTALRVSSSYEQSAGSTSWTVTPFFRYNDNAFVPGWQLGYNPVVWEWDNRTVGLMAQVRHELNVMDAHLTAGVDLDVTPGQREEPRITPVEEDGVWVDWSLDTEPQAYDYDIVYRGAAGYAQLDFSPIERLRLTAGARFDAAGYDYETNLEPIQTGPTRRPPDTSVSFTQLTPKFGAVYEVSPRLRLMGAYRRGFRVPIEQQLFKQGSSVNTIDLEPIKVASWELGVRTTPSGRLRLEATAYHMRLIDDILSFRDIDGVTAATNNGETLHRGIELTLGAALTSDLTLDAGYAYAKHEFTSWRPTAETDFSGFEMDAAPRHQRNAQLTWTPSLLRGGSLQLDYQGMSDYWLDQEHTMRQDGYDVFHVRGSYRVHDRVEVFARLMNVFDTLYAAQGFVGFGDIPRVLSPGEYRTLYIGASGRVF